MCKHTVNFLRKQREKSIEKESLMPYQLVVIISWVVSVNLIALYCILLSGTEDLKKEMRRMADKMDDQAEKIDDLTDQVNEQSMEIARLNKTVGKQNEEIQSQRVEIDHLNDEVAVQKKKSKKLQEQLVVRDEVIVELSCLADEKQIEIEDQTVELEIGMLLFLLSSSLLFLWWTDAL